MLEKVREMRFQEQNRYREPGVEAERVGSSKKVGIWRPGGGSWRERERMKGGLKSTGDHSLVRERERDIPSLGL